MIRIAQASSSEYYTEWGTPPNQRRTGATKANPGGNMDGELNIMPWYRGPWKIRFRAKNPKIREKIAWLMERTVENGAYGGYGQNNGSFPRTGLFDALMQMSTPDPMKIKRLFNCDCSSSAGACIYFAGVYEPKLRNVWTGNFEEILDGTMQFEKETEGLDSTKGLLRGDILWKPGHVVIVIDSDMEPITTPYLITKCAYCNLRSGPSINNAILAVLKTGTPVDLISFADNGWGQVVADGKTGYVSGMYLEEMLPALIKGDVWLRETAGTTGKKIMVLPKGATVYQTGLTQKVGSTTWRQLSYDGKLGWSSGNYVKV